MALSTATHPRPGGAAQAGSPRKPTRAQRQLRRQEGVAGYVFLSPWLLGLMAITAFPILFSLYLSFTNFDILSGWEAAEWVGLDNYRRMFSQDPSYWHAVQVTVTYALIAVPLKLAGALGVALLLNRERRGVGLFRSLFYLPSLLGGSVALALVWRAMFSRDGAVNDLLGTLGWENPPAWVNDPQWALETLMVLGVWQFGAPMVIFLAGLKQIPVELYEAAAVDGAGRFRQFVNVTLPMLSPVIFFNLVLETIHGFQGFTSAYVISNGSGGPVYSTLLYTLHIYEQSFAQFRMGYGAALSWVFLIAIALITVAFFSTGKFWVHYSDGDD